MTQEERLQQLEPENRQLKEQLAQRDELIERLTQRVRDLEERLSKNSRTSSLPPSSDRFARQPKSLRKKSGKKPGGQAKHPGSTLVMSEHPDEMLVHKVVTCQYCQADLQTEKVLFIHRRQVVDTAVARLIVQEHQAEQKWCPACCQVTLAPFPCGVDAPVQYGMRVAAIAVYLVQQHLLPWARACEILSDLLGIELSAGSLATLIERCAAKLIGVEERVKQALILAPVLHQNETGLYVKGSHRWLHVACTAHLTHYAVHAKRRRLLKTFGSCPAGYTHDDLERLLDLLYGLFSHVYTTIELRQIIVSDPFDRSEHQRQLKLLELADWLEALVA